MGVFLVTLDEMQVPGVQCSAAQGGERAVLNHSHILPPSQPHAAESLYFSTNHK